jgi:aminopeptidase N
MTRTLLLLTLGFFGLISCSFGQPGDAVRLTHQDTLRGTYGKERQWWDVMHYDVAVKPDYDKKTITGRTTIRYKVLSNQTDYLQLDLQQPLQIDSLFYNGKFYINYPAKPFFQEGNVWHVPLPKEAVNSIQSLTIVYHGSPRVARNAPWDGGWVFKKDKAGDPWMSVACQGLGASVWYPCKDHQSDEPDSGATLRITVPEKEVAVGNGRLQSKKTENGFTTYQWAVTSPINSYNIIPYIGNYVSWSDTLMGEKGKLDLTYWALKQDLEKAKKQFVQVKPMIRAFEYWFGPYPFYEDGFQLVQAPYLGMEHQGAIAYGNEFKNGYLGRDLSGSGWGLKWDYIIVHESGHEWFANNITTKDIADMWVHEGFTNYSEVLYTDYYYGREAGNEYARGLRENIQNDAPIIGPYGVNKEGSSDMYYKGANLLHTIRQVINNDEQFRQILRGLNKDFYHQTVTSKQVEDYINEKSGKNFSKVFDQYLRTRVVPELSWKVSGNELSFKWNNCVPGFDLPVKLTNGQWIKPTSTLQKVTISPVIKDLAVDPNFYISIK